ncbi:unnamed protein product, partial [Prorocentrum cordatum]
GALPSEWMLAGGAPDAAVPADPVAAPDAGLRSEPAPAPQAAGAPKPPSWEMPERRPHTLEVELDELELLPAAPNLAPSWYEGLRYYVSLHPTSEQYEDVPAPREAPRATADGSHLVSQMQPPRSPEVQVEGPAAGACPVVRFGESLVLRLEQFESGLVAYVWARKASVLGETFTLVGRATAPLHRFDLQRRPAAWQVLSPVGGSPVALLRLKYAICTTPGAVGRPAVADAQQTELRIRWAAPEKDHGAPVVGYRLAIAMPRAGPNEAPEWLTLCECTKSLKPVYVITNLTGNTTYAVSIQAVNKVGAGDPCEFQVSTAPVPPGPPGRPRIEEVRDGCFSVAWRPAQCDGGCPIIAYKVRMRKILGATRWNPFGPGESQASWSDMGTVATGHPNKRGDQVVSTWIGPLEPCACEYRFQVVALSRAGEGVGSELSEPQYT